MGRPAAIEAGLQIGGYELVRRLGRGGMAEVWVARKLGRARQQKYVAVKLMADKLVGQERYSRMFRAEVDLSAMLTHANVVQVFDEGEEDGRAYLVMEWVDGINLVKLGAVLSLCDEELRDRIAAYVVGQLLHALAYAHSITTHDGKDLGIVHRDVTPQNVLISNHGDVKLTDFGVAHFVLDESSGLHVKGKVRYMSPEQLAGNTRTPKLDLYAAGAILHELVDGKRFRADADNQQAMYADILGGKTPPLSRAIPAELDAVRLGLLDPDHDARIPTAEAAIEKLRLWSGYGEMKLELARLCATMTGVVRPRTGPGRSDPSGKPASAPPAGAKLGPYAGGPRVRSDAGQAVRPSSAPGRAGPQPFGTSPGYAPHASGAPGSAPQGAAGAGQASPTAAGAAKVGGSGTEPAAAPVRTIALTPGELAAEERGATVLLPGGGLPDDVVRRDSVASDDATPGDSDLRDATTATSLVASQRMAATDPGSDPESFAPPPGLRWYSIAAILLGALGLGIGATWLAFTLMADAPGDAAAASVIEADAAKLSVASAADADAGAAVDEDPNELQIGNAAAVDDARGDGDGAAAVDGDAGADGDAADGAAIAKMDAGADGSVGAAGDAAGERDAEAADAEDGAGEPEADPGAPGAADAAEQAGAKPEGPKAARRSNPKKPRPADKTSDKTPKATVAVQIRLSGLPRADVKLGRRVLSATPYFDGRFAVGTHRVKWRAQPSDSWKSAGTFRFVEGSHYMIRVSAKGPRLESK